MPAFARVINVKEKRGKFRWWIVTVGTDVLEMKTVSCPVQKLPSLSPEERRLAVCAGICLCLSDAREKVWTIFFICFVFLHCVLYVLSGPLLFHSTSIDFDPNEKSHRRLILLC